MIILEISPEHSLYVQGAYIIKILLKNPVNKMSIKDFIKFIKEELNTPLPINILILTLDWLFLIDVINIDNDGNILNVARKN